MFRGKNQSLIYVSPVPFSFLLPTEEGKPLPVHLVSSSALPISGRTPKLCVYDTMVLGVTPPGSILNLTLQALQGGCEYLIP